MEIRPIAIYSGGFDDKFGIPRQSGLVSLPGAIEIKKEYCDPNAFRGIEEFSHLWLVWKFDVPEGHPFSPTVRPPRLGGNVRKGVFATRSPFRPNKLGLSSVRFEGIECTEGKITIFVSGADLMNGTEIFDIKPYIPYSDSHPDACGSFSEQGLEHSLEVAFAEDADCALKDEIAELLALDPRPSYQNDDQRIYTMEYNQFEVKFTANERKINVISIKEKTE